MYVSISTSRLSSARRQRLTGFHDEGLDGDVLRPLLVRVEPLAPAGLPERHERRQRRAEGQEGERLWAKGRTETEDDDNASGKGRVENWLHQCWY